ncbi:hypothetical protein ACHAQA_001123 [Verticillium albo-atrum]
MPTDDPLTNFFIRFKKQVDEQIGTALQGALGLPTVLSKNMNTHWMDSPATTSTTSPDGTASTNSNDKTAGSDQTRDPASESANSFPLASLSALLDPEVLAETLYQSLWISFLVDSPHSPLRLRDLRQPVPRDLPNGADPRLFGFEDAFEDLLMVSSGQGLPDIQERCELKKEWNRLYPHGLPPALWLHQLCRQGLWDGWEPRPASLEDMISERWRRWLQEQDARFEDKPATHVDGQQPQGVRAATTMKSVTPSSDNSNDSSKTEETEEDAYNTAASRQNVHSIEAHLGELMKAFADIGERRTGVDEQETHSPRSNNKLPEGWRVDEKVQEQTDGNGNTKTTRTCITYDEQGREVGRETESRSHFSWSAGNSNRLEDGKHSGDHKNEPGDANRGWVWK